MIKFKNLNKAVPYQKFKEKYDEAFIAGQENIEVISISSFNKKLDEVDSRFVNLKFVEDVNFIFFSNYNSPKSIAFESHNQISAVFYWQSINTQIRIKAKIARTSEDYNNNYFKNRSADKNLLAISSYQSKKIRSYDDVITNFINAKKTQDSTLCPSYWGGFSFTPYSFEFWEGHKSRINKRYAFNKTNNKWNWFILQP